MLTNLPLHYLIKKASHIIKGGKVGGRERERESHVLLTRKLFWDCIKLGSRALNKGR